MRGKKKTTEEVRLFVEEQGYELMSTVYKSTNFKIKFRCPKGHKFEMRYDSFCAGHRCQVCAWGQKNNKEIIEYIESQDYKWVSGKYQNAGSKLILKCSKNHLFKTTWRTFYNTGCRCPVCAGTKRKLPEEVRKFIEKQGYKWISGKYKNNTSKLKLECLKGHLFKTTWNSFYSSNKCPICSYINSLGPNNPAWRGGISKDPYCEIWNIKDFKEMVKTRDGNK